MSAMTWQYKPKNKTNREDHMPSKPKPPAMRPPAIQAKLTVGQPNDMYEREADRLADRVMRMIDGVLVSPETGSLVNGQSSLVQRKAGCPGGCPEEEGVTPLVQRQSLDDEEEMLQAKSASLVQRQSLDDEEEMLQAKSTSVQTPAVTPGIESRINSLKGGGQALSPATRSFFEPRFGADFSHVRVHTGSTAAQTAQSINAKAYTTGNNIAFNRGQYSPDSTSGKHLLAHELTHVVQQQNRIRPKIQMARLLDYGNRDPCSLPDSAIMETNEYKAYISPNLVWRRELNITEGEAILACRLIQEEMKNGNPVNWYSKARYFALLARQRINNSTRTGKDGGAHPVNFQQDRVELEARGGLVFYYKWDSSTGDLNDLGGCSMGELVNYKSTECPPFQTGVGMHLITGVNGKNGKMGDRHHARLVKPFKNSTETAQQWYWFSCPCYANGREVFFFRSPIVIRRMLRSRDGENYVYMIEKSGRRHSANANEVDIESRCNDE